MTTLGPYSFLNTIFIIVAVYYVGKFLFKRWIKIKIATHGQRMNNSVDPNEAGQRRKAEGHVSIKQEHKVEGGAQGSQKSGDYIDFEEVD